MYYLPQPPFLAALAGIFVALTFGTVFQNLIEQKLRESYQNPQAKTSFILDNPVLAAAFSGICFGVWMFLGGGLLILGFGVIPSYGVALLLTIFTGALVWDQLQEVLMQLKEGGSEALSLD